MESAKLFFRENPFPASPAADRYLAIGSVEVARKRLMDAIDRRECPGMLVGPPGTGKSLLCTLIASAYRNEFDVVLLAESRLCTRKALLQHLLHHLGLPYSDQTEGELRLSLIDRAASGGPASRAGLLIVVDEAHTLPGRLLEELRMMSGIVRNGSPRVQLVLAGGPSLDERFAHPRMEAFSQRISTRCYLHPLGQSETGHYIRDAIRHAGADPQRVIDSEAIAAVYYAADGIPRLVNQTMSRAVALAEAEAQPRITADTVQRAWADLQQLPSPVVGRPASVSQLHGKAEEPFASVEFGMLEDDGEEVDPMADTVDYDVEVLRSAESPTAGAPAPQSQPAERQTAGSAPAPSQIEAAAAEPGAPELESAELESAELESAELESAELESAELESAELESAELGSVGRTVAQLDSADSDSDTADLESVDWAPSVVELGDWEPSFTEYGDWDSAGVEAGAAANAEQEGSDLPVGGEEEFSSREPVSCGYSASEASGTVDASVATDVLALFGDGYDEEESLHPIAAIRPLSGAGSVPLTVQGLRSDSEPAETAIHREIVSINAEAVRNESYGEFAGLSLSNDILIADDSDILVIEDDVELDARPNGFPPQRPHAPGGSAGEISFQSMFTRMREG